MPVTHEAISFACDRVEGFALINAGKPSQEKMDAVHVLLNGFGLDEDLRAYLHERLSDLMTDGSEVHPVGALMAGVLIGLWMAEY